MKTASIKSVVFALSMSLASLPLLQDSAKASLVPTQAIQSEQKADRAEDLKTIQSTLEMKAVRGRLQALGLTDEEIQSRMSRLSDEEVHQMASQIRAIQPAGFLIGVLVAVLLVILIIFLIKRI